MSADLYGIKYGSREPVIGGQAGGGGTGGGDEPCEVLSENLTNHLVDKATTHGFYNSSLAFGDGTILVDAVTFHLDDTTGGDLLRPDEIRQSIEGVLGFLSFQGVDFKKVKEHEGEQL